MSRQTIKKAILGFFIVVALLAVGVAAGLWWERNVVPGGRMEMPAESSKDGRTVLYWYDPMYPNQKFDKPGKSPFMDMELVPKYADEGGDASTVSINPGVSQNLGVRLATVTRAPLDSTVTATGIVDFNERDVAIVQARSGGFVERVARLAPNDVIGSGAFIAELLVPEWAALQEEYLALRALGDPALEEAARARMRLGGMPESLIREVAASGRIRSRIAITAPRGGVIQSLDVRAGMTLMAGQTLARINGIGTVWLDVAVPESQAGAVRVGQSAEAVFAAFPGKPVQGRVTALLPALDVADFGCGSGALSVEMARWARSVTAIDASPQALAKARERAEASGEGLARRIRFLKDDLHALSLKAGSLDLVVISQSLHHVEAPDKVLREAARVLKPGGHCVLIELLPHKEKWVLDRLGHRWQGLEPEAVRGWLKAAGFTRLELDASVSRTTDPFRVFLFTAQIADES
jgi:2-polyprenyl-3-methyl-5-hydroxy-6-metoxy-1,4-benzoquinol methylase